MSKEQSKALFYTQSKDETLETLESSRDGLSTAEAQKRLDEYGHNELDEGEKRVIINSWSLHFSITVSFSSLV